MKESFGKTPQNSEPKGEEKSGALSRRAFLGGMASLAFTAGEAGAQTQSETTGQAIEAERPLIARHTLKHPERGELVFELRYRKPEPNDHTTPIRALYINGVEQNVLVANVARTGPTYIEFRTQEGEVEKVFYPFLTALKTGKKTTYVSKGIEYILQP